MNNEIRNGNDLGGKLIAIHKQWIHPHIGLINHMLSSKTKHGRDMKTKWGTRVDNQEQSTRQWTHHDMGHKPPYVSNKKNHT